MLVPVKMAVETESPVSIFGHRLAFNFFQLLALSSALNTRKTLCTFIFGLGTDLQRLQGQCRRYSR